MAKFDNISGYLSNLFSYALHGESKADRARKPQAVTALANASQAALGTTEDMKLNEALACIKSRDLDTLLANKVAVCLDDRLPQAKVELRDSPVFGAFYTNGDKGYILAINPGGATSHAPELLAKLARSFREGVINPNTPPMFGTVHTTAAARTAISYMNWDSAEMVGRTLAKNPAIKTAPKP
ncbi:MAG: hypothetical protein ACAH80_11470 [Alphaproteobacteria bacterium]